MKKKQSLAYRITISTIYKSTIYFLAFLLLIPLVFILFDIFKKGIQVINWEFLTQIPAPLGEDGGGVANAIIGSLMIVFLAVLIAVPIGVFIGIFLAENQHSKLAKASRFSIEMLQAVPSIVIGIVAYSWIVVPMNGFSMVSGSIALAFMIVPLVAKSTEETVKLIPVTLKEAAYALGAPYYRTIFRVVIPSSKQGILAGIILGIARILGETAPLLFTAFGNAFMSFGLSKPVNALPLLIYNYATSPYESWQNIAWGASLLLIVFVLMLSLFAKWIGR